MRKSISTRLFSIFLGMLCITVFIFWATNQLLISKLNEDLTLAGEHHLNQALNQEIENSQRLIATTISDQLTRPVYNLDFTQIGNIIEDIDKNTPLLFAYVYDHKGMIIHDGSPEIHRYGMAIDSIKNVALGPSPEFAIKIEDDLVHVSIPIHSGINHIGGISYATLYYSNINDLESFNRQIQRESRAATSQTLYWMTAVSVIFLLLSIPAIGNLSKRVTGPLKQLSDISQKISRGEPHKNFTLSQQDEIGDLSRSLQTMTEQLQVSNKKLEVMAYIDELSGLPNRRHFTLLFKQAMAQHKPEREALVLYVMDVDDFKLINDSKGHTVGDQTLRMIGQCLNEICQESALKNAMVSRLGGDEFGLFVNFSASSRLAQTVRLSGQYLQGSLNRHLHQHPGMQGVNVSIGACISGLHSDDADEMLKLADLALIRAKANGKNCFTLFDNALAKEHSLRTTIADSFCGCLANGDIQLHFQAIYNHKTGSLIGAEALARWHHPEFGPLAPDVFIPILEQSNKIGQLSSWAITQTIAAAQLLFKNSHINPREFFFSVNLSTADVLDQEQAQAISALLKQASALGLKLCLEITETSMMQDLDRGQRQLARWRSEGADIWIDDFGTGYSSLSYLQNLPINTIKLDKSFIKDVNDNGNRAIINAVSVIANSLSLQVLAEGVKTVEQAEICVAHGICLQQGYYHSKPCDIDAFITAVEASSMHA